MQTYSRYVKTYSGTPAELTEVYEVSSAHVLHYHPGSVTEVHSYREPSADSYRPRHVRALCW